MAEWLPGIVMHYGQGNCWVGWPINLVLHGPHALNHLELSGTSYLLSQLHGRAARIPKAPASMLEAACRKIQFAGCGAGRDLVESPRKFLSSVKHTPPMQ